MRCCWRPKVGTRGPSPAKTRPDKLAEGLKLGRLTRAIFGPIAPSSRPFIDFFARHKWTGLLVLALIGAYRVPDFVMGVMANPLYIDLGFSLAAIATVRQTLRRVDDDIGRDHGRACGGALRHCALAVSRARAATITGNLIFAWLATQGPAFPL